MSIEKKESFLLLIRNFAAIFVVVKYFKSEKKLCLLIVFRKFNFKINGISFIFKLKILKFEIWKNIFQNWQMQKNVFLH